MIAANEKTETQNEDDREEEVGSTKRVAASGYHDHHHEYAQSTAAEVYHADIPPLLDVGVE